MSNKLSLFKKFTLLTLTTSVTIGCSDIFALSLPSNSSIEVNSLIDSVSELSEIISSSIYSETSVYVSSEYISESLSSYIDSISSSEEWVSSEELSSYLSSEISSSSELSQEELSSIISESISEYISSESYSEEDYSSEILSSSISSFYSSSSVDYYSFSESEYYSSSSENHSSSSDYYSSSEYTSSEHYSSSENTSDECYSSSEDSSEYYSSSEQSSSEYYSSSEDSSDYYSSSENQSSEYYSSSEDSSEHYSSSEQSSSEYYSSSEDSSSEYYSSSEQSSSEYYSSSEDSSEYYSSSEQSSSEYYSSSEDSSSEYYSSSEQSSSSEYYSSSEQSSSEHYSSSENSSSESFSHPDSVTSIDDSVIPDPELPYTPSTRVKNAISSIMGTVYTSLMYELSYLGYEVYYAKLDDEMGLAYASYDRLYSVKSNNVINTIIVPVGFISFSANLYIDETFDELESSSFESNYISKKVEIYDSTFTNKVTYSGKNVEFDLLLRDTNIKNGHFVSNNKYVQYQYRDEVVDISIQNNNSSNYVLYYGSIYNYDESDYVFIPYKEIPSDPITFTSIAGAVNLDNMEDAIDNFITEQNNNGYTLQSTALFMLDADYLNRLTASLKTEAQINGILVEKLNSLNYDESRQYVHFKADGSIEIRDLPPIAVAAYEAGDKTSILNSFANILLVAGGLAVGVVLSTFAAPYGGVALGGLVLGAVGEFASQTLIQGKNISNVNWLKVGVSAVCSSLLASIPLGSSVATTCAGLLSSGLVGAGKQVLGALTEGETDVDELVVKGATGAAFSMISYGIRTLKYGGSEQQPSKPKEPEPLKDLDTGGGGSTPPNLFRRSNVKIEVYDSQEWEMIKSYFGENGPYVYVEQTITGEAIQEVCNETSYVAQSAFHDSLVEKTSSTVEVATEKVVVPVIETVKETVKEMIEEFFGLEL